MGLEELRGASEMPQATEGACVAISSASSPGSVRLAALVEYDGTAYAGFQLQKDSATIQGALENGLAAIMGRPVRVIPAGRTDAGVHALGQVVHLQATWPHSLGELQRAWNANLPRDVAVRAVARVGPTFHARFSARSRVYRYTVYNEAVRRPLLERYAWHVNRPLAIDRMDEAAARLLGRHDLVAFGRAPQGENTVRTVLRARCWQQGELIRFEIEADAFLQHMVRRVTATLVAVGRGRLSVDEFGAIIGARDPRRVVGMAPPNGLCLVAVHYEAGLVDWSLPSQESWQKESYLA